MSIETLRIDGVRNLRGVDLSPARLMNCLVGPNGAGKTSVLEALHCVAAGRSFRGSSPGAWVNRSSGRAEIFVAVGGHRLGLAQTRGEWTGRVDGAAVKTRAALSSHLPLFVFHPDSHEFVDGAPEVRRRVVDFGVFHVEHRFLDRWRGYRRAHQQRNAALRQGAASQLAAWEEAMVSHGMEVTALRRGHVRALNEALAELQVEIEPRIPALSLEWYPGWPEDEPLQAALERSRETDLERGYTGPGAHRGDLRIRDEEGLIAGRYSRGQQKIVALLGLLAQARTVELARSVEPILAVDDLDSELDADHEERVGHWLRAQPWQVWVTALEPPPWLKAGEAHAMFHVEQGRVRPML